MARNILLIFEGQNTEDDYVTSLNKFFFNENVVIKTAFCNDVYELYEEIVNDEFLDVFLLLKNIDHNKEILGKYKSIDFSEIYLFFDFDGHDDKATDIKLESVIEHFIEETDMGKIYISYPMIESLKHIPRKGIFKDLVVPARENIHYKNLVSKNIDKIYNHVRDYNRETWSYLITEHLKKMNFIIDNQYTLPDQRYSQIEIFQNQKEKYIDPDGTIAVLNALPIFILDNYGLRLMKKLAS